MTAGDVPANVLYYICNYKRSIFRQVVVIMCGRYQFTAEQCEEIRRIAQEIQRRHGDGAWTPGEIRPTAAAPVLLADQKGVHPELLSWGYRLPKSLVINARAESAAEKPLFRDSVKARRCVVPSTGFYEWDAEKRKYFFTLPGEEALYMAGLYDIREGRSCYCILTTEANRSMEAVHPRMPLILSREQLKDWLEKPEKAEELLRSVPPELEKQPMERQLSFW